MDFAEAEGLEARFMEQIDDLGRCMLPLRLQITPEIKERLGRFSVGLLKWNRRLGLLSRGDIENIVRKHIGASLGALLLLEDDRGTPWVDVGSGAGFPGLVLKLWDPKQEVVLIEGSHRKCVFLNSMATSLGAGPMRILSARVETLIARGEMVGAFRVLLVRAVTDLSSTLKYFGPLVSKGGKILTFKGPGWQADADRAVSLGILGEGQYHLESVTAIPWTPGRILMIRKT